MSDFNQNHATTIAYVNDAIAAAWEKMKVWVETNIDDSNLMQVVKGMLDQANREVIGTTATAKAQAVLNSVNAIAVALQDAGAQMTDKTFAQFADIVRSMAATSYEVCILGKSGTHYTTNQWNDYIAEHGTTPEEAVVAVITPYQSFVIALPPVETPQSYKSLQWGNTTDNVTGLYGQQVGSFLDVLQNNLNFKSIENTWRMLLWYNPEKLPHRNYDPSDPSIDYGSYGCVRFATKAEMEASGQHLMSDQQVYIVTNDESDNTTNQCYYWNGSAYARRFVVPRFANNITGSPAAEYAWQYKAWNDDARQYALPTTNHLLMMYVYYSEINACLSTLNRSPLPTGYSWTCQQGNANNAYYVAIPTANVSSNNKNGTCAVLPVAAL